MFPEPSLSHRRGTQLVELDEPLVASLLQVVHQAAQAFHLVQLVQLDHTLRVSALASEEAVTHVQSL